MSPPVRIGISSCLLGQKVRYDGGDKRAPFLLETLGRFVEWVPVCPEFEMGLGVPREAIHLVTGGARGVRLVGEESGADHTSAMRQYARRKLDELAALDLCGYIFKKGSPSCGLWEVEVWRPEDPRNRHPNARERSGALGPRERPSLAGCRGPRHPNNARGLFAAILVERFPRLPVEEEDRLSDVRLRENFIERVFAYARLKAKRG